MVGVGTLIIMVATQVSAANNAAKINFFVFIFFPLLSIIPEKAVAFVPVTEYHYMHNWLYENNHFKQI